MVAQTEAVSSKRMVSFSILPNRLSLIRNSLFYTYPPQSVRCDRKLSFVESNRYLLAVYDS